MTPNMQWTQHTCSIRCHDGWHVDRLETTSDGVLAEVDISSQRDQLLEAYEATDVRIRQVADTTWEIEWLPRQEENLNSK